MTNSVPLPPPADAPGEAQQPPSGRPELRRSTTDRMAGGVCGGLADYSGIDAVLWRVGFVGLTVAGGAGVLVYLLLWVLMPAGPPRSDETPSPLERLVQRLHETLTGRRPAPPR
ncbi:PspC domain-containing protein [Blastococcus sp. MG754426]|uniref:PspC domain-containing protein n=1 Tax=unclassified Blastococcus TaxID=2619396 RepID=UPI001EF009EE|nr:MULTISPECIES: PspC domain-containing protein [unclassified Blastococcus]MCF6507361.1 PspC domain-containing protein [Blastococcus sp. MG754426]MCF6511433.1 PspC domain-containing protein [Blastococcus sp. MG754427]MCF6736290.1 PspC domain-containing protein [Blastococcus sp. KM273129]